MKDGNLVSEQVEKMKYLGVSISSDGKMVKKVEARIGSSTRMIGGMSEAVRSELMSDSAALEFTVDNQISRAFRSVYRSFSTGNTK